MRCIVVRFHTLIATLLVSTTLLLAQEGKTIQENGKSYLLYTVASGEGFFSIQKRYGVTKEELIEANSDLAEKGLRGGQVIKIPTKGENTQGESCKETLHTIAKGESVMGITKRYQITVEQLFDWNPDLSASTFTIGRTIRVTPPTKTNKTTSSIHAKYIVQPQETLYGLSKRFGVTVEELAAANGNITSVNVGQELIVPAATVSTIRTAATLTEATPITTAAPIATTRATKESNSISVAILFPLGLDDKGDPELSKRLLDFYRGFLLSADSIRKTGINIDISFYDTGNGASKVDSIIHTGELDKMDAIIAPSHSDQIDKIVTFGQAHDIRVLLPFSSKGEWVNKHSMVMQMNPPAALQNAIVFDHWKQRYRNANFIFITSNTVKGERVEFVESAKKYLKSNGIAYKQYNHRLDSVLNIQKLIDPTAENVIITEYASIRNLKTILLDLQIIVKQQPDLQFNLWGYPEWQTFFLDFGDAYFDLNVHLFTSFYADYSNEQLKKVESSFKNIYQRNMLNTYPRFGLLGYDIGLYLLSDKYEHFATMEGLQSGFFFKRFDRNKGGAINHNLFIVEYAKDQTIKRLNISGN